MKQRRIFVDIVQKHAASSERCIRVDLGVKKHIRIPLRRFVRYCIISFFIFSFVLGSVTAPVDKGILFAASNKEVERAQLEAELKELETQIAEYENTVDDYRRQGVSLESEIKRLNAKITSLNLQIRTIILNLEKLDEEIDKTEQDISQTESDISINKKALSELLQNVYENENRSVVEMMIANSKLSDFFLDLNNLLVLQDNVRITLEHVIQLKSDLIGQQETLALEYQDVYQLKQIQERQRSLVRNTESDKKDLLEVTKGEEERYQTILEEKKKTAAEVRSRIFALIGGGELSFGEAYRLAGMASDKTGVSPELSLAVMDRESGFGRNVGQCEYDKNPYYSNKTSMHPTRDIPVFLAMIKRLERNDVPVPDPPLVSCPIPRDGVYGGAMGPAQFIPSTWEMYEDRIAKVSGHNPPSPWNNLDAFVGTSLYLSDSYNSSGCVKYANDYPQYNSVTLRSRCAAAKYYAGGNWFKYRFLYGEPILERAEQFERDIKILNG